MLVKPVCVKCKCFYRPEKNGFAFTEGMPNKMGEYGLNYSANIRGNRHPECWSPYKCWMGDLWKCPDCGNEIVLGVISSSPLAEHYQNDFEEKQKLYGADKLQVNDC